MSIVASAAADTLADKTALLRDSSITNARTSLQEHVQAPQLPPPELSMLDRFLPLWIVLAAALGFALGQLEQVHAFIESTTVGSMNVLVGIGLLAMMYLPLASVRWPLVRTAITTDWRLLAISTLQNWVVGPALMFGLSIAFFHNDAGFLAGFSLVGCARCIGMVMIWIALAGGDLEYGAALIALNAVLTMALYSLYASFLLDTLPNAIGVVDMTTDSSKAQQFDLQLTVADVAANVALYMGVPFALALVSWLVLTRVYSPEWYYTAFASRLDAVALFALLGTVALLFASQSQRLGTSVAPVLIAAVPFSVYFALMFATTFALARVVGRASFPQCVTLAFTATSNNYELSLGVAVATFGLDSDPAMMSVVAALIEIPTMLALVWLARYAETRFVYAGDNSRSGSFESVSVAESGLATARYKALASPSEQSGTQS